jgi:hypothetical protein
MNCEEIQNLLPDFDDDILNPITRYAIQNHLKTCGPCNEELNQIRLLFQTISDSCIEQPGPSLREHFNKMLDEEIQMLGNKNLERRSLKTRVLSLPWVTYAWGLVAAMVIFFAGLFLGSNSNPNREVGSSKQISELKNEVKDVKEMLMFDLLKEPSASARIKAVNYVDEMPNPDNKVLGALINTLNHDKNVNVRLASLYSLAKFTDFQLVRDSLVNSLKIQTEPVIQIVLINLLSEKKEIKAIQSIQDIISNKSTLKEVKEIAQQGLKSI